MDYDVVLVTGGCGFIGANLVRKFLEKGCRVRVLDNLSGGRKENLPIGIEFMEGDIREKRTVEEAIKGVDIVVHLAAHTSVVDSIKNPELDFGVNVRGTLNLLRASIENSVNKFIFASSNAVVRERNPPIDEEKVPKPLSPYGASKLACEGYCSAFSWSFSLETVSLRFSNVYGPYSFHKNSVIAKFIKAILNDSPLVIYGDGEQTRDFIYVDDLCNAVILTIKNGKGGEVFQIGTGQETKILEAQRGLVGYR